MTCCFSLKLLKASCYLCHKLQHYDDQSNTLIKDQLIAVISTEITFRLFPCLSVLFSFSEVLFHFHAVSLLDSH